MANFYMNAGNRLPVLEDQLLDDDGNPTPLDGYTVHLNFQNLRTGTVKTGLATVLTPKEDARVRYEWAANDTTTWGDYIADWHGTHPDGRTIDYPNDGKPIEFTISPGAVVPMAIAAFRRFIRTMLGDTGPDIYQFSAVELDDAVRLVVNLGRAPGVALTEDALGLTPAVSPTNAEQSLNWARIVYYSAKLFIMPNVSSSSFRTRALSESFGESRERVFDLLQEIYEMENGIGGE